MLLRGFFSDAYKNMHKRNLRVVINVKVKKKSFVFSAISNKFSYI